MIIITQQINPIWPPGCLGILFPTYVRTLRNFHCCWMISMIHRITPQRHSHLVTLFPHSSGIQKSYTVFVIQKALKIFPHFFFNFNYTIKDWLKFFLNWVILRNNKTILWSVWFYLPLNTFPQLKFIFQWHFSDKSNCLSFENIQAQYILTWCNYQHFQAAHLRGPKKMLN